jgi:hypothetical protein
VIRVPSGFRKVWPLPGLDTYSTFATRPIRRDSVTQQAVKIASLYCIMTGHGHEFVKDRLQEPAISPLEETTVMQICGIGTGLVINEPTTYLVNTEYSQGRRRTHRGKRGGRQCKKAFIAAGGAKAREEAENFDGSAPIADEPALSDSDGQWEVVVVEEARKVTKS